MNNEMIAKMIAKYQARVIEIFKEAKTSDDYQAIGHKVVELVREISDIKLGDFL